jgi:hypothetical protein
LAATLTAAPRSYDAATSLAGCERRTCLTSRNSLVEELLPLLLRLGRLELLTEAKTHRTCVA